MNNPQPQVQIQPYLNSRHIHNFHVGEDSRLDTCMQMMAFYLSSCMKMMPCNLNPEPCCHPVKKSTESGKHSASSVPAGITARVAVCG